MKLNFKKTGKGEPLIILHGLFGAADNWLSIAKELQEDFTMYLLDQRNHGDSPQTDEWNYEVMAQDIFELMEDEGIAKAHVMGHSMGGKTAMKFAMKYPEKVEKLIVADISPRFYPIHHQTILEGLNAIPVQDLQSRKEAEDILSKYIPDLGTRQFLLKSLTRDGGHFKWKINLPVITEQIANVGEALEAEGSFVNPVLFLAGEKSDYIQDKDREEIAQFFPNHQLVTIKNAGHWLHAEQPAAVVETVKVFLL
jgi:esterase